MRYCLVFFLAILPTFFSQMLYGLSLQKTSEGTSRSSSEKGFFSIALLGGYQQARLLNQDGSYSSSKGSILGAAIDLQIWETGNNGQIRIFAQVSSGTSQGEVDTTERFNRNESIYGIKFYPNSNFFLAGGLGQDSIKVRNTSGEELLSTKITVIGLGFEFGLTESTFVGLGAWYKSGPLKKDENASLPGNSHFDAAEALLFLIWSPPMTAFNYSK